MSFYSRLTEESRRCILCALLDQVYGEDWERRRAFVEEALERFGRWP